MRERCLKPSVLCYPRYGGRGITVCERWQESFENFLADMGPKPTPQHSIDRIDNNGNYEPGNCRWATKAEQARNLRSNVIIEYNGERRCVSEWAAIRGIYKDTVRKRVLAGWTAGQILGFEPRPAPPVQRLVELNGVSRSLADWCRHYGADEKLVSGRINRLGWPIEKALTAPCRQTR